MLNTLIEQVRADGLVKFAGDQAAAQNYVEGFVAELEKVAYDDDKDDSKGGLGGKFTGAAVGAIGKGLGGLVAGLGMHGMGYLMSSVQNDRLHSDFLLALQKAVTTNKILRDANRDKVKGYAETVFKFAPHVAGDANVLSSVLANAIHGEGLDPMTVRSLNDLETRYVENSRTPVFSPKSYV
jgi:hypothetical protein